MYLILKAPLSYSLVERLQDEFAFVCKLLISGSASIQKSISATPNGAFQCMSFTTL